MSAIQREHASILSPPTDMPVAGQADRERLLRLHLPVSQSLLLVRWKRAPPALNRGAIGFATRAPEQLVSAASTPVVSAAGWSTRPPPPLLPPDDAPGAALSAALPGSLSAPVAPGLPSPIAQASVAVLVGATPKGCDCFESDLAAVAVSSGVTRGAKGC